MMKIVVSCIVCFAIYLGAYAVQYSKLQIITAAKEAGKWEQLKQMIQAAGFYDEWLVCQYLSDSHPLYAGITNGIVASGIADTTELAAILEKSVDPSVPDDVLRNRYERDSRTESGRTAWHGKMVKQIVDTNALTRVTVYEDGHEYREPWKMQNPKEAVDVYNSKLPKPPMTNGVPAKLAAARARRYQEKITVSNVTETVTVGGGAKE